MEDFIFVYKEKIYKISKDDKVNKYKSFTEAHYILSVKEGDDFRDIYKFVSLGMCELIKKIRHNATH